MLKYYNIYTELFVFSIIPFKFAENNEIFNEIFVQIYKIMEKQTNDYRDFLTEGQRIRLKRNQEIKARYQSYLDRGIRPWRAVCRLSTEFNLSTSTIYVITNYNRHIL